MSINSDLGMNQGGKSGGDAMGSAGFDAGSGMGYGDAFASGGWGADAFAAGTGIGDAGNASAAQNSGAAFGGDVSDNTSIGSININS